MKRKSKCPSVDISMSYGHGQRSMSSVKEFKNNFVKIDNNYTMFHDIYTISDNILGQGSFGKVIQGYNKNSKKKVAIKFQINKDHDHLFEEEIDTLNRISKICKNYICIDGWGKQEGYYFIAMDLIEGIALKNFHGALSEAKFLKIGRQLSHALDMLHKAGIAHMDLKPDNIMIDVNLNVKLIDLGLSCHVPLCGNGGSPYYMPPKAIYKPLMTLIERKKMDFYSLVITMAELEANIVKKGVIRMILFRRIPPIMVTSRVRAFFDGILKKSRLNKLIK